MRVRACAYLCRSFFSLQVEGEKRTVAGGSARVNGIKETQQTKTQDGSVNLFSVKLTSLALVGAFLNGEVESSTAGK